MLCSFSTWQDVYVGADPAPQSGPDHPRSPGHAHPFAPAPRRSAPPPRPTPLPPTPRARPVLRGAGARCSAPRPWCSRSWPPTWPPSRTPTRSTRAATSSSDTALLDKLPSGSGSKQWWDQVVIGKDRWQLRRDGVIYKNGLLLYKLPRFNPSIGAFFLFVDLEIAEVDGQQVVYALSEDGRIFVNGPDNTPIQLLPFSVNPETGFNDFWGFREMDAHEGEIWSLRSDGRIYRGAGTEYVYDFGNVTSQQPYL